jgi:hypothetical protein
MMKIIITGGPAADYILRCLGTLVSQTVKDWQAYVVLDPVGDMTYERACSVKDSRITVVLNQERSYALWNTCVGIDAMAPADDDVIVSVDADDWLTGPDSLEWVKVAYMADPNLMLTYGSWVGHPNPKVRTNTWGPYTEEEFKGNIRKLSWRGSHLKTFKHRLWKRVDRKDFKDPRGTGYYRVSWDLAFMWPMLEMAGHKRVRWIPQRIYTHNQATPFNDSKVHLREQMVLTNFIAAQPQYKYVEDI